MKIELDKKDRRILSELTLNSRVPLNRLARKVQVSREVATYRINRLVKSRIIKDFYTIISAETLGFQRYGCFFQFKGVSKPKEEEFIDYLVKHEFVNYLSPVIGRWNVVFDLHAKNKEHLKEIIYQISEKFGKYLKKYTIIGLETELESFPLKIFGSGKELDDKNNNKNFKIDETDRKILKIISNNSRAEYKEISEKTEMSANAIKYRIKNLENSGIIQGYTLSVDIKELGHEFYNIQVKTGDEKDNKLRNFFRNNKHVTYFYKYLGNENWDFDIGLNVKSSSELREFILELREKFGDILEVKEIYVVVGERKGNYLPRGIFKTDSQNQQLTLKTKTNNQ
ncbi:MAG: Lrp/AsnC family transcriptional regulator [Candidatus Pacearchaeota archaeon]